MTNVNVKHKMRLHEEPYNMFKKGIKTIEYRVNDEKRRTLKIGDLITFYKRSEEIESFKVEVIELNYFNDLLSMYTAYFDTDFKDRYNTPIDVVNDTPYYTDEEVLKYGCVAIKVRVIED